MRSYGLRNPERNSVISGIIAAAGLMSVGLGVREMIAIGHETVRSAPMVGFGLVAAIFGVGFFINFMWASRIFRDMRNGRTTIARWTLSSEQFASYCEIDRRCAERGQVNDYKPPRVTPAGGIEVIFSDDGVLIGDYFFGLATTGISRFNSVQLINSDPPMLEFGTVSTAATNLSRPRVYNITGALRVPVAPDATREGNMIGLHYRDIIDRRLIVKPHFWRRRIRGGLIFAFVSALLGATGFALADRNEELGDIPLVLGVAGTIFAMSGLLLAVLAWAIRKRQFRR